MPANYKVSVGWQIVATFMIIANFWAFYRIRKLRKYLLYVGVPSYLFAGALIYISFIGWWVALPSVGGFDMTESAPAIWGIVPPVFITIQLIGWGLQGLSIYLVIIWSRQHNRNFETQPLSG